jgi:hypothetical protein
VKKHFHGDVWPDVGFMLRINDICQHSGQVCLVHLETVAVRNNGKYEF